MTHKQNAKILLAMLGSATISYGLATGPQTLIEVVKQLIILSWSIVALAGVIHLFTKRDTK